MSDQSNCDSDCFQTVSSRTKRVEREPGTQIGGGEKGVREGCRRATVDALAVMKVDSQSLDSIRSGQWCSLGGCAHHLSTLEEPGEGRRTDEGHLTTCRDAAALSTMSSPEHHFAAPPARLRRNDPPTAATRPGSEIFQSKYFRGTYRTVASLYPLYYYWTSKLSIILMIGILRLFGTPLRPISSWLPDSKPNQIW
jgi:hypothetical protein